MPKKILFLTTLNLATNPRLVKEIKLACSSGYAAEVICFEFDNWSKELNESTKRQLGSVKIFVIPAGRRPFFYWVQSVFTERFYRLIGKLVSLPAPLLSQAVSRRSNLLIKALHKVSKPDCVIGHNPGAFWPTMFAGKIFNCKTGYAA